jgi:hypothetical protein
MVERPTIKQFVQSTGLDKVTLVVGSTSFDMDENGMWLNGSNRQDTQGYWDRFPAEFLVQCTTTGQDLVKHIAYLDTFTELKIKNNINDEIVLVLNNPQVICWKSNKS